MHDNRRRQYPRSENSLQNRKLRYCASPYYHSKDAVKPGLTVTTDKSRDTQAHST